MAENHTTVPVHLKCNVLISTPEVGVVVVSMVLPTVTDIFGYYDLWFVFLLSSLFSLSPVTCRGITVQVLSIIIINIV